jgi:hypothetical protein
VGGQLAETSYRPTEGIVAQGVINTGTTANPVYIPNTTAISAESYYRQYMTMKRIMYMMLHS